MKTLILLFSFACLLPAADPILGEGATFPAPLYHKWIGSFEKKYPGTGILYRATGSGAGIDALAKGTVDFAASDFPLDGERLASFPRKIQQIPVVIGGVVPVYHLEGVLEDLRFTPETLAGIYLGEIRRWNDPAIRASNRGVTLPAREITVVHRSDRSGSTFIWTSYLARISALWKSSIGVGDSVKWPVGVGAEQNEGIAQLVSRTPDSIGYVEFIYAITNKLDYAAVRNNSGRFVQADLASLQAAANNLDSPTVPESRDAYPIASVTYFLVPEDLPAQGKQLIMLEFLNWMLTSGQKQAAALGYVELPPAIAARALKLTEKLRSR